MTAHALPLIDPLAVAIPRSRTGKLVFGLWLSLSVLGHAGLVLGLPPHTPPLARRAPDATEIFDVERVPLARPDDPPPDPTSEAPKLEPEKAQAPAQKPRAPTREAAPVEAPEVLTQPDSARVLDFTDHVVSGSNAAFSGGTASASGLSRASAANAAPRGAEPGPVRAPEPNLSRASSMLGATRWACPFPAAADDRGIDRAVVSLRVHTGADGRVVLVEILSDPGFGFGPAARRCAQARRFRPALDREGKPTTGQVILNVRFVR